MPYITQRQRDDLVGFNLPRNSGELNYLISMLLRQYLKTHGKTYATINDILGALSGATLEFYRRVAAPYEDDALARNGDLVYNKSTK